MSVKISYFLFQGFQIGDVSCVKVMLPPPLSSEVVMSPVMFSMRMTEVRQKLSFMVISLRTDHSFLRKENKGSPLQGRGSPEPDKEHQPQQP